MTAKETKDVSRQGIYSEALSALAFIMLNVITNEYITPVSKTMHSKLKESPVVGPRTHVEPANGFQSTAEDRVAGEK